MPPTGAGAAATSSYVTITDPAGDTIQAEGGVNNPKADITSVGARYENNLLVFTMRTAQGDDLTKAGNQLYWFITDSAEDCCDFFVSLKRAANGSPEVVMGNPDDPSDLPESCVGSAASFDVSAGTYSASVPSQCFGQLASFQWGARRLVEATQSGGPDLGSDFAPDEGKGFAAAVTNTKVGIGYWAIGSDGRVYNFGEAPKLGEPATPGMIDIEAAAPHGPGYWAMDEKGVVTTFGPVHYGSVAAADLKAGEKAVSISGTPTGAGYWVFTNQGRVFAFGDATKNLGDLSTVKLNGEILDSAPTPTGKGYYLVAADGGVFTLGDAVFEGSMGGTRLNQPVQSIVPDPDGTGYWRVASDGGVFTFKAVFKGSTGNVKLNKPMTGMVPYGDGYLMVAEDGGVFNFSDKPFSGSLGSNPPANPIVSITALR